MSLHDQQNPWGKKNKPSGPEDLLAILLQKLRDAFSDNPKEGGPNEPPQQRSLFSGLIKLMLVIFAVLLFQGMLSSFFTIDTGEVGVILRFGKHQRTTPSGLHFKAPYIEKLIKVDVEHVHKEEFGFRTRTPGQTTIYDRKGFEKESLMITGDKNVINVAWIVQYRVTDPVQYLFQVKDVKQAVRDASEMVTRRIVGNMDFDYVLGNRDKLANDAQIELQGELDNLECGIKIFTLQLLDINPPDPVKPAFNEVNEADQDMKRLVNEAEETYNRVIPKARGSAEQTIKEAEGYAIERINKAKGETSRFNAIVHEYLQAEDVTRTRMYLEAMHDILPKVKQIYVMDQEKQTILPFLDLTKGHDVNDPKK